MRIQDMMTQNKFLNILTTLILSTAATINTILYGLQMMLAGIKRN